MRVVVPKWGRDVYKRQWYAHVQIVPDALDGLEQGIKIAAEHNLFNRRAQLAVHDALPFAQQRKIARHSVDSGMQPADFLDKHAVLRLFVQDLRVVVAGFDIEIVWADDHG